MFPSLLLIDCVTLSKSPGPSGSWLTSLPNEGAEHAFSKAFSSSQVLWLVAGEFLWKDMKDSEVNNEDRTLPGKW